MQMSDYSINLELPTYLSQWLLHENGGEQPIAMPKLSLENKILELCLMKLPHNARPDVRTETSVAIAIPTFRRKPPATYNYLPANARDELKKAIRSRFIVQLFQDLHKFGYIGKRKDNLFYAWMEAHGIEPTETNWCAIAKIYQRLHRNYLERERYKKKVQKR